LRREYLRRANENPGYPWVRAGQAGDWAFAFDGGCADAHELERIAIELSAGTETVLFNMNPALDYFRYFADGAEVTAFEPLLAYDRSGSEPDRFVPFMRQAGIRTDPASYSGVDDSFSGPVVALLEMLTLTPGVRLSRDDALGAPLTPQLGGTGLR
jgi:hypothetical protein